MTVARLVKAGKLAPAKTLRGRGGYVFTVEEIERYRATRTRKPHRRRQAAA